MPVKFGVAYDGSEQGKRALERCLLVAKSAQDEVHLIHAIGSCNPPEFLWFKPHRPARKPSTNCRELLLLPTRVVFLFLPLAVVHRSYPSAADPPRTDPPFGMLLDEAEKVIEERRQHAQKLLEPIVADLKRHDLVRLPQGQFIFRHDAAASMIREVANRLP